MCLFPIPQMPEQPDAGRQSLPFGVLAVVSGMRQRVGLIKMKRFCLQLEIFLWLTEAAL